jgi:hypothetical protein
MGQSHKKLDSKSGLVSATLGKTRRNGGVASNLAIVAVGRSCCHWLKLDTRLTPRATKINNAATEGRKI